MKKTGTRFLVGFMMATMLAVVARAQTAAFAPNAEGKQQFAVNAETEFEQTAGSNPPEKYGRLAPSYFSPSLVSQGRLAEGRAQFAANAQTTQKQFAVNTETQNKFTANAKAQT